MRYKFCVIFAVVVLVSCKTTRTISKPTVKGKSPVVEVIEQIQKAQPQFQTANVNKMVMALEVGERKVNVSATCKIKMDSVIYLSIQPFMGIELFKAEFTTDSLRVFDKMNRRYYTADYSYFSNRFGVKVDFYSLQALLTSRFFCVGGKEIPTDSCKLTPLTAGQNRIDYASENMLQTTTISAQNVVQQVLLKAINSGYQLQTDYSDYLLQNGVNFPQKIALQAGNQKTKATCNFSILRVDFNTDLKFIPTSSERFTRGDLDQLLKK